MACDPVLRVLRRDLVNRLWAAASDYKCGYQGRSAPLLGPVIKLRKEFRKEDQFREAATALTVVSGGMWHAGRIRECHQRCMDKGKRLVGPMPSGRCRLCGAPCEDELHVGWTCRVTQGADSVRRLQDDELRREAVECGANDMALWTRALAEPIELPGPIEAARARYLPDVAWRPGVYYTDASGGASNRQTSSFVGSEVAPPSWPRGVAGTGWTSRWWSMRWLPFCRGTGRR